MTYFLDCGHIFINIATNYSAPIEISYKRVNGTIITWLKQLYFLVLQLSMMGQINISLNITSYYKSRNNLCIN